MERRRPHAAPTDIAGRARGTRRHAAAHGFDLVPVVALLAAASSRCRSSSASASARCSAISPPALVIGPFGLRLFADPQAILHVAELGVVHVPVHHRAGDAAVAAVGPAPGDLRARRCCRSASARALLTGVGLAARLSARAVASSPATGFVLTSTAIVMQMLDERGEIVDAARASASSSILLLEDLAIVPLLALVAFLAPGGAEATPGARGWRRDRASASPRSSALVAAGRWLLNPMFRILADAEAREVMTAAALLVVLGAALLMQVGGLSMAMGAFLAGVLLSESTFRHQLEADIEPFRGILLGLFFLAVGMSLDLARGRRATGSSSPSTSSPTWW